jgi:hypothetical protein
MISRGFILIRWRRDKMWRRKLQSSHEMTISAGYLRWRIRSHLCFVCTSVSSRACNRMVQSHARRWFSALRNGSDGGNWQIFPLRKDTTTSASFHLGFGHALLLLTMAMAATLLTMKQHRSISIASPESGAECFNGCLRYRWAMGAALQTKSKEN